MKNIFKIIAVITTLLIATFTFGCSNPVETQQSKYEKLHKQYAEFVQKIGDETIAKKQKAKTDKEVIQLTKEFIEKWVEKGEPMVNELEKIAKGNKELEENAKAERKGLEHNKKILEKIKNGTYNPLII